MARALRVTYPGAFYHVTSRVNERKAVFKSKRVAQKLEKDKRLKKRLLDWKANKSVKNEDLTPMTSPYDFVTPMTS